MTAEHLGNTSHQMCRRRSAVSWGSSVSRHRQRSASQSTRPHCPGGVQQEEHSQTDTFTVCGHIPHPAYPNYELSRASRTFMICCLITLVASPALGIRYLRGERKKNERKIKNCKGPSGFIFRKINTCRMNPVT